MSQTKAIAIVGMGAILPEAFNVPAFWENVANRRYSITTVPDDRWSVNKYYDPDPAVPDKTYTKIGAFVQGYQLDAFKLGLPIPPRVISMMDYAQQWAIAASSQALIDYGYPNRPLDPERVAVIFGNSNAGERHYISTLRIHAPEYLEILQSMPNFQQLPLETQRSLLDGLLSGIRAKVPDITEDTMPGELSNIIAGRVANVFNFSGPNFVTDAACASSLAALQAAVDGLDNRKFDAVLTGGIDRSMGPESYVKFCKIGALSVDGSRPYADGANGFVMGEGAVVFLLKRLDDAEAAGDKIYAVIRGIGGSSDGKGKGITAPNPLGQQRAIERAWNDSGLNPATVGLIEGHGTSTKVGDVTEVGSLNAAFAPHQMRKGSVALGSVKSNIGHLKSAAGAVGLLKTSLALYHKVLPPSVNFDRPNPNIDFSGMPFYVNTSLQSWEVNKGEARRAGISSFGFGGTNFHVVLEEYRPGMLELSGTLFVSAQPAAADSAAHIVPADPMTEVPQTTPVPLAAGVDLAEITRFVLAAVSEKTGYPPEMLDLELDLEADLGVDTVKQAELFASIRTHYGIARREDLRLSDYNTLTKVIHFMADAMAGISSPGTALPTAEYAATNAHSIPQPTAQQRSETSPLPYQGLFFVSADSRDELKVELSREIGRVKNGQIPPSFCPSMDRVAKKERIAIDYVDAAELLKRAEKALNALDLDAPNAWQALQGQGIYRGSGHPGKVVFMFPGQGSQYVNMLKDLYESEIVVKATFDEADAVMSPILGKPLTAFIYVDGDEEAIAQAERNLKNTAITQPAMLTANVALLRVMEKYGFVPDMVIGHSLGEYAALVAAGVMSFAQALEVVSARGQEMTKLKMEDNGCMAAVSAPLGKVEEVLQSIQGYVVIANLNSPLQSVIGGETAAVDEAVTRFTSEGFQAVKIPVSHAFHTRIVAPASIPLMEVIKRMDIHPPERTIIANVTGDVYPSTRDEIVQILGAQVASPVQFVKSMSTLYDLGARAFVEVGPKRVLNALAADNQKDKPGVALLATNHPRKGGKASFNEALCGLFASGIGGTPVQPDLPTSHASPVQKLEYVKERIEGIQDGRMPLTGSVVVTGAGLGLPGKDNRVFDDRNIESILSGEMRIGLFSDDLRKSMLDMKVTRLVKSEAGAVMEEVTDVEQTIKLAGQRGDFDLEKDFGVPEERVGSLDISSQLAIAAGIEALRDAGIPLVMNYKSTSRGTYLPDRWKLPVAMQDETGVIFCAAFPGLDRMAQETDAYSQYQVLSAQLDEVQTLIFQFSKAGTPQVVTALEQRAIDLRNHIEQLNYSFDRRFIFRVLSMGHSQFAEYIGAKGPNTHVNAACATTTHAVSIAEDWIRNGRCRRVIIIAGDDVTNPNLVKWIGTSMFASGAATTEGNVRIAALPFDRRRNGMIMGMGAAALVLECEDAARERGVRGICEVAATVTANSAFHGTRLDVNHVSSIMERLISVAESRFNDLRADIAPRLAFISHETYTPARGGSAAAEIHALRQTFGSVANQVIVANTKGFTGHSMGVGIEDVIAVKILETGKVPPIAHIHEGFEPDTDLGDLNLSRGGKYDPQYALRLGAGFGSQIAMSLYRKVEGSGDRINQAVYRPWLMEMSGYDHADLELTTRTLRIKDQGEPRRIPAGSHWQYGQGPTLWAGRPGNIHPSAVMETATKTSSSKALTGSTVSPVPAASVQRTADVDEIKTHVLQVVSEKTGYPPEMLDLELDLEADLGIDTVKQAELFAAIRTHYGIPRREDLGLAEYNTLNKVIGFVTGNLDQSSVPTSMQTPVPLVAEQPIVEKSSEAAAPGIENGSGPDEIRVHVLGVVSEKTGYPPEMLDLELDLEADLGIDTVKQAELFASIRTFYGIPRREDLRLSEYNTLNKVIGFVVENLSQSNLEKSQASGGPAEEPKREVYKEEVDPAIQRRVPRLVMRPRLDLCLPTGVELNENSRILIVRDSGKVADALVKKLKARGVQTLTVAASDAASQAMEWNERGAIQGVYFLPAIESDPAWRNTDLTMWKSAINQRVETLFALAKVLPDQTFVIAATRMGGLMGFSGTFNPLGGVVTGFVKSLARERKLTFAKVVDFEIASSPTNIASQLLDETLHDSSAVEISRQGDLRYTPVVIEEEVPANTLSLARGSVFVVSGGTAGIIPPIVIDLAHATQGTFYLLSRSPLLPAEDPRLKKLAEDREGLKSEIAAAITDAGKKATPVAIGEQLSMLDKAKAMHEMIAAVSALGGHVENIICDVQDARSTSEAVRLIATKAGRVDVFIHAAGVEKSRKLESKSFEEFHQVMDVKMDGFYNLYKEMQKMECSPRRVVFFTSVAGRFGNAGQVDYSAANDGLSKISAWLNNTQPAVQAISIDWGAWAEVGMASRGSIPLMMERAGITMMKPGAAAVFVRRELEAGTRGEVILAGNLGGLQLPVGEGHGLDTARADAALRAGTPEHAMLSHVVDFDAQGMLHLETMLDPANHAFLQDHAINGTPVLPGVIGIEGFSVAARHIASTLAGRKGGFSVERLEDIRFLAPFKFYKNQPRHIQWKARAVKENDNLVVYATLESDSARHDGSNQHLLHFSGKVYLVEKTITAAVSTDIPVWADAAAVCADDIYRLYFHGPSFQVIDCASRSGDAILGKLAERVKDAAKDGQLSIPMLVELCFQTAGLWEAASTGTMALPHAIGSLVIYPRPVNGEAIFAEVHPVQSDGLLRFNARVVDSKGRVFLELQNYQTSPLPYTSDPGLLAPMRVLIENS